MTHVSKLAGWSVLAVILGAAVARGGPDVTQLADRAASAGDDWPTYLGDKSRTHYSPLAQMTRGNVHTLEVAWTFETGDRGEYQANNLVIDGVLYTATPARKVIALDAATGKERWRWDPTSERPGTGARQRGLAYWRSDTGGEARLFTGVGNYLYALDPATGQLIRTFGENGSLHLGTGVDTRTGAPAAIGLNTPGLVYRDLYIFSGNHEGPGSVRAYDVRTGALRWIFHTIPRPGEFGLDTWPADGPGTSGGASNWSGSALDEVRGIVYVPTESATPDFWGGDRHGANLFANSLIALDANTGRRLWHYQIVHHDLLDKDLPTPPVLLTVTHNGRRIDAVAQGTKHGLLFVFNRETGEPLWPIHERPVPQTSLPGEQTWPTQPVPEKPAPLMRQIYTEADVSTASPEARAMTLERIKRVGSSGAFPAPSLKETIIFPGYDGGMEWGGGAADPDGIYYVNINEMPWVYQMLPTRRPDGSPLSLGERTYLTQCASCHGLDRSGDAASGVPPLTNLADRQTPARSLEIVEKGGGGRMPAMSADLPEGQRRAVVDFLHGIEQAATAYQAARGGGRGRAAEPPRGGAARVGAAPAAGRGAVAGAGRGRGGGPPYAFVGFRRWLDREGYAAIAPPWGTLNAVDLNTGDIKWQVPLGEYPELTARGLPPTGTENYGGPVVTAGGLIFIGATADETIRAFDKDTGRILWQAKLPFGGNATPSTYMVNGRQYVVISAGGGKSGRASGGSIVAFRLRD